MLWAVHIADGVLSEPWLVVGFAAAFVLALLSVCALRFREDDIARVALLTAAFFVASLIHVRVGPTSVHLLLNGLLGAVLGWQAAVAIPIGLFLQAALFGHGGFTSLGVNSCVMVFPALLAWLLLNGLHRWPGVRRPAFRYFLVAGFVFMWMLSCVYSLALLSSNGLRSLQALDTAWANGVTFHPAPLGACLVVACLAARLEMRLGNKPEFALGLLVGELTVLATVGLSSAVLALGGAEDWRAIALLSFVAHLPIAVIEGIVLGFVVSFLASVKPELLGWTPNGNLMAKARADSPSSNALNGRTVHVPASEPKAPPCPALEHPGDARPVQSSQCASS